MIFKADDILVLKLKDFKGYKLKIIRAYDDKYDFTYIEIQPYSATSIKHQIFTADYLDLESECEFCPEYLREKKLKKILDV